MKKRVIIFTFATSLCSWSIFAMDGQWRNQRQREGSLPPLSLAAQMQMDLNALRRELRRGVTSAERFQQIAEEISSIGLTVMRFPRSGSVSDLTQMRDFYSLQELASFVNELLHEHYQYRVLSDSSYAEHESIASSSEMETDREASFRLVNLREVQLPMNFLQQLPVPEAMRNALMQARPIITFSVGNMLVQTSPAA